MKALRKLTSFDFFGAFHLSYFVFKAYHNRFKSKYVQLKNSKPPFFSVIVYGNLLASLFKSAADKPSFFALIAIFFCSFTLGSPKSRSGIEKDIASIMKPNTNSITFTITLPPSTPLNYQQNLKKTQYCYC